MTMSKNRSEISNSQSATRTMNFHGENHRSRRLIGRTIFSTSKVKKTKMASRFVDAGSVEDFISEQENKSTAKKTQRDVKL